MAACTGKDGASGSGPAASPPKTAPVHAPLGEPEEDAPWPVSAEAEEQAAVAANARAIDRALCPETRCCVTELMEAGRDRKGADLFVVGLHGDGPCVAPPPPSPPSPFGSGNLDRSPAPGRKAKIRAAAARARAAKAENEENSEGPHDCTPMDFHLVARKGGRVRDVALLTHSCDTPADFPFASGDTVAVDKEKKVVTQSGAGGMNLWGDFSLSVGLDPLRLVSASSNSFYRSNPNDTTARSWNWEIFAGTSQWSLMDCKKKEQQETDRRRRDAGARNDDEGEEPMISIESVMIPEVTLPADFVANGWQTTGLGACSASLDHSIFGDAGRSPASAKVVVSGATLFVEVTDDRFVGPGKNWVKDDHLELWMGTASDDSSSRCSADGDKGKMVQWGIRVADGEVFPAQGAPPPLTGVERVVNKRKARFKIPLPTIGDRITVVYSNSDDGKRQWHLMATSQLRFGDSATLGATFSPECGCVVKKGVLQPQCDPPTADNDKGVMEGWEGRL
jgi:uncharacterized protein YndB with AHSA1/START domain